MIEGSGHTDVLWQVHISLNPRRQVQLRRGKTNRPLGDVTDWLSVLHLLNQYGSFFGQVSQSVLQIAVLWVVQCQQCRNEASSDPKSAWNRTRCRSAPLTTEPSHILKNVTELSETLQIWKIILFFFLSKNNVGAVLPRSWPIVISRPSLNSRKRRPKKIKFLMVCTFKPRN